MFVGIRKSILEATGEIIEEWKWMGSFLRCAPDR
jgi:hypothetical protein